MKCKMSLQKVDNARNISFFNNIVFILVKGNIRPNPSAISQNIRFGIINVILS